MNCIDRKNSARRRLLLILAAACGIALFAIPEAFGQANQPDAAGATSSQLDEILVTAQRRSENIQNVPVSVQAISAAQLQAQGIKDTTGLASLTPNVTISMPDGQGAQPNISIRGIGLNDYNTNNAGPNGVYYDDVYISAPYSQTFGLFDLQQALVLKGPQGTLYGRNTSGGALVFTSQRPTDDFTGDFSAEYGSYNTWQLQGALGGPIAENLDGRVAFVVNRSDGYIYNEHTHSDTNNVDNQTVRLQLLYKPTAQLRVLLESVIGYVDNDPGQFRHYGTYVPGTQGSASPALCSVAQVYAGGCVDMAGYGTPRNFFEGDYYPTGEMRNTTSINGLHIDYDLDFATLTSITSFQYGNFYLPQDGSGGAQNLLTTIYGADNHTWTQEFRLAHNTETYNWVAGAYYLGETLRQDQPLQLFYDGDLTGGFGIPPGPGAFDGVAQISSDFSRQGTQSLAAFGQGDRTWGDFTLTLGGRYTHEKKSFDYLGYTQYQQGGRGNYGPITDVISEDESQSQSNFTWRTSLSYRLTSQILGYASAATGFKSGDFNGGFLSNVESVAQLQLRPIAPEKVTAYEVGLKSTVFDRRLIVNGAAFYNEYRDEQVLTTQPVALASETGTPVETIVTTLTNVKRSHTQGVELSATALPIRGLTIEVQPAWLTTRIDDAGAAVVPGPGSASTGDQLANAPHFSFYGSASYKISLQSGGDLGILFGSSYKGRQFLDVSEDPYLVEGGYWIHNLNITYYSHDHWDLGFFVHNFTDTHYFTANYDEGASFGALAATVGQPRMFGGRLAYHF
jgi:iron complex outermembrane recepter protein